MGTMDLLELLGLDPSWEQDPQILEDSMPRKTRVILPNAVVYPGGVRVTAVYPDDPVTGHPAISSIPIPNPEALAKGLNFDKVPDRLELFDRLKVGGGPFKLPYVLLTRELVSFYYNNPKLLRPNRIKGAGSPKVKEYCRRMTRGEWVQGGGHSADYNEEGQITNSYTRMQGVMLSNVPILLQFRGPITEADNSVVDEGQPRSSKDRLELHYGLSHADSPHVFERVQRTIRDHLYDRVLDYPQDDHHIQRTLTPELTKSWKELWPPVKGQRDLMSFRKIGTLAAFVYVHASLLKVGDVAQLNILRALWGQIVTSNNLHVGTAAHTMALRIGTPTEGSNGGNREKDLALMQRLLHGIEAHMAGRTLSKLGRRNTILNRAMQQDLFNAEGTQ